MEKSLRMLGQLTSHDDFPAIAVFSLTMIGLLLLLHHCYELDREERNQFRRR